MMLEDVEKKELSSLGRFAFCQVTFSKFQGLGL